MLSKLTLKRPERYNCHSSVVFIADFEDISHLFLVFVWLVNFEQVNVSCVPGCDKKRRNYKVNCLSTFKSTKSIPD